MKKSIKLFAIVLAVMMLVPFISVNADSSKAEVIAKKLNSSDSLKGVGGTAKYEDGTLSIEYVVPDTSFCSFEFPYEGNVISYVSNEVTNYEEAETEMSAALFVTQLLYSALKLNGYTQDQISAYFGSETSKPTFEVNGFEINSIGEEKKFTSEDGSSTLTALSMSVKVDVSKANLNAPGDPAAEPKSTTVQNVVDNLSADKSFVKYEDEGKVYFENTISDDGDGRIMIDHTDYTYDYHYISFECENDVLTYTAEKISSYYEANLVAEQEMWALVIMQYALEENGYSNEEISAFFRSEENELDYDKCGIEYKELGKAKTFKSGADAVTVSPISIKIDLANARITNAGKEYKVLKGTGQLFDMSKGGKLTFTFDIDYAVFVKEGRVFIDNKEVSRDNYSLSKGSTVVTFNDEFVNKLSLGKHTVLASVNSGQASAEFTISDTNGAYMKSPKTGDAAVFCAAFFMILAAGALLLIVRFRKPAE